MEMEVILSGTHINVNEAYSNIILQIKNEADILLSLHEPKFDGMDSIPE